MKTFSLRKFFAIFFLCLIPLVMLAFLYFDLETYKEITHNECGAFLCIESALAFVICSVIALCNRRRWPLCSTLETKSRSASSARRLPPKTSAS